MAGTETRPIEQVLRPLTTQIVGSYSKPAWLVRRDKAFRFGDEPWRPDPEVLDEARRDAVRLAVYEQERAGLDIITDGEAQRAVYDRHFYARLGGVDLPDLPPAAVTENPRPSKAEEFARIEQNRPRITGPVTWSGPLSRAELQFLKRQTTKPVKATVIGPLTAYDKMADDYYRSPREGLLAVAKAINAELRSLDEEGVDLLQLDEPRFHLSAELALLHGQEVLEVVTRGVTAPIVVHVCYGYAYYTGAKEPRDAYADALSLLASSNSVAAISLEYEQPGHQPELLRACGEKHVLLGLLNLGTEQVESPEHIARRIADALCVVPPERLHPCSDCGMWHLPREIAYAKICALVAGTRRISISPGA